MNLTRRQFRYWCFRYQKKELDGVPVGKDAPKGFRKNVEEMRGFDGWEQFAKGAPRGWDISHEEPWTIIPRNHSIEDEWNAELARTVPVLVPLDPREDDDNGSEGNV